MDAVAAEALRAAQRIGADYRVQLRSGRHQRLAAGGHGQPPARGADDSAGAAIRDGQRCGARCGGIRQDGDTDRHDLRAQRSRQPQSGRGDGDGGLRGRGARALLGLLLELPLHDVAGDGRDGFCHERAGARSGSRPIPRARLVVLDAAPPDAAAQRYFAPVAQRLDDRRCRRDAAGAVAHGADRVTTSRTSSTAPP